MASANRNLVLTIVNGGSVPVAVDARVTWQEQPRGASFNAVDGVLSGKEVDWHDNREIPPGKTRDYPVAVLSSAEERDCKATVVPLFRNTLEADYRDNVSYCP